VGVVLDRLLQAVGDDLAHAADRDVLKVRAGSGNGRAADSLLHILLGDLATLAGSLEAVEADTVLTGQSLGGRRGIGLAVEGGLQLALGGRVLLGLGCGRRGRGRGRLRLGLLLLLGLGSLGVAACVLEGELFEGRDVGALLDKDGNGLRRKY